MNEAAPHLFDSSLVRRRLARADVSRAGFLLDRIADELAQRMDLVRRNFPITLIHGYGSRSAARRLEPTGRFGTILTSASHLDSSNQLAFDPEVLPFAPQS